MIYNISNIYSTPSRFVSTNLTIQQFCEKHNLGTKRFYIKMRDLGIIYSDCNEPTPDYETYFKPYSTWYSEKVGRESFYITEAGQKFILSLVTPHDFDIMKRGKYARQRNKTDYKHYE